MSENRIILIENPSYLSINLGRLKISRKKQEDTFILPSDIAVLCMHHHTIQLSVHVLKALSNAGAAILVTDEQHHPAGLMLPCVANQLLRQRLRLQINLELACKQGIVWQQIVTARIQTQAKNLRSLKYKGAIRLERLALQVKPEDTANIEGQATRHYWKHLFDNKFLRHKQGAIDSTNVHLNYGSAVLRAMVARQLVLNGLNTALGVGHNNQQNPFNLADDFMEPYRFVVERQVHNMQLTQQEITPESKYKLLGFVKAEITMKQGNFRLVNAIAETITSYCRLLEGKQSVLTLPQDASMED